MHPAGLRGQFAVQLSGGAELEELAATMKARATESIPTLNSSMMRYAKVMPPMLTSSLATRVQMISTQRVRVQVLTEALDECCREVAAQHALQVGSSAKSVCSRAG